MMRRSLVWSGTFLLAAAPLVPVSGQARPRPSSDTLPVIEVVATRRAEAPDRVPASIEVLRGEDLRARGARNLRDALALTTGVAIAPGGDGGPAGSVPEFWGLREFDAFLLVVDGVPWGGALNPALSTLNLRDVERIEVLRGPAPVTYGATSFVGVIHVVHNQAAANSQLYGAYGGSYGSGGVSADLGVPMWGDGEGSWQSRVSASLDRQRFKDDRTGFEQAHVLWRSSRTNGGQRTWVTGDVNVLRQDPASPHPRQGTALSSAVPIDANHNPADAYLNETRLAVSGGWQRPMASGSLWGTTLSYTHSSQRLFRGFLTDVSSDPDNASGFRENIDINDVYADTHILWGGSGTVRVLTGVDGLFANGEGKGAVFAYSVPLAGNTATTVPEPTNLNLDAETRRFFAGAYGSVEWSLSERVTLSAGLRLNAANERYGEGESVTHTRLSGSVGALIGLWEKDGDHLRFFANYRNTFKPAAFDFGLAENEGVLDPETSQSYEAGLKFRAGRVDMEVSGFRMDFTNLVTATVIDNLPALTNSGETRFQGLEVATDIVLPHDLVARASYSFHDGKFRDFERSFDGVVTQLAGNRFEMSARHLASAGVTHAPAIGFLASVNVNYTGDRYLDKRNRALAPEFLTLDAGVGYRFDRFEIRVDARNLTDRRDPVSESEFGDAQYYRMTARSIVAGIALRY